VLFENVGSLGSHNNNDECANISEDLRGFCDQS